ncbi:histidine phosphatase family protein [Kineococcus glutinatus]|uniref:Histidine phosphatase family protein n=1 Tax=Kineococcus glutinatus TaxID=1070872 RepID=A0ABP9H4T5_9ACTN
MAADGERTGGAGARTSERAGWPAGLLLVRHGESTGNLADRAAHEASAEELELTERDADVPLSELGHRQARAVGRELAAQVGRGEVGAPGVVLSSPYRRARDTAAGVLAGSGLDVPLCLDERLRERDLGWWDGLTGRGVRARYPQESARRDRLGKMYYRPPGGESWCDVSLRVRSLLRDLRLDHAGRRVLVVTHQAVIMNFRLVLEDLGEERLMELDRREPLANCSVTAYDGDADGMALRFAGSTAWVRRRDEPVTDDPVDDDRLGADDRHGTGRGGGAR